MSELMVFAPVLPFFGLLAWGVWKQRKNPRLPLALAAGGMACAMILAVGYGAILLAGVVAVLALLLGVSGGALLKAIGRFD